MSFIYIKSGADESSEYKYKYIYVAITAERFVILVQSPLREMMRTIEFARIELTKHSENKTKRRKKKKLSS